MSDPDLIPELWITETDLEVAAYVSFMLTVAGEEFEVRKIPESCLIRFAVREHAKPAMVSIWRIAEAIKDGKGIDAKKAIKDVMFTILEAQKKNG